MPQFVDHVLQLGRALLHGACLLTPTTEPWGAQTSYSAVADGGDVELLLAFAVAILFVPRRWSRIA